MRKFSALILLSFIGILCFSQTNSDNKIIEGKLVIKLKQDISRSSFQENQDIKNLKSSFNFDIEPMFPHEKAPQQKRDKHGNQLVDLTRFYTVNLNRNTNQSACIKALMKTQLIEYIEPRYIPELLYETNDPLKVNQYYLETIKAFDAWDIAQGDTNVIIAIVDTGIDMDHEDFFNNIAYNINDPLDGIDNDNDGFVDNFRGWDMGDNDNFPQNEMNQHGTFCAGLSSAHTDNEKGISGCGFKCRLLPVKIQDSDSLLSMAYEGVVYAANHGAKVINCSWGDKHASKFEQDMINYAAINKDVLIVAACGNDNDSINFYPASYDNVLSVAATTELDEKWSGSSFGYHVDLAAPGAGVYSTKDGGGYQILSGGTSFAAPIVSGIGGILRAKHPELSAIQCIEYLKNSTDVIDTIAANQEYQDLLGTGRINMLKAVSDTSLPGLVLKNITIIDDRENNYQNSLLVEVQGEMYNYLSTASNVTVNLSMVSSNATLINNAFSLGTINNLSLVDISGDMIQLELNPDFNYNEEVVIKLDINSDNYHRVQYIQFQAFPSYRNISNGDLSLSVPANGRFGFVDLIRQVGNGLNYINEFRDLFFDSGWIIGNQSNRIMSAVRNVNEFQQTEPSRFIETEVADKAVLSKFKAYNSITDFNFHFNQTTYAWYNIPNALMINTEISNESNTAFNDLYAGVFTDWELVKGKRNVIKWDGNRKIAYCEHTGNNKLYAGWIILSSQNTNHYALDQLDDSNDLVNAVNGLNNEEKYYCLSHTNHTAGEGTGSDVSHT